MPIPFIIGGLAVAAGIFGAAKGVKAKDNYKQAKEIVDDALEDFESAQSKLGRQKTRVSSSLMHLGEIRLTVESNLMHRFVNSISQVNQVSYTPIELGGVDVQVSEPKLKEITLSAYNAADVMKDGVSAVSAGTLTGIGASGLATSIGAASTGTAISSLSGVAATNATLAWLGGGSLAAGGMGMAGGMAVLGGAIAGPVIAVMGYTAAAKSEIALTQAEEKVSEISIAIEQIDNGIVILSTISARCDELEGSILAVGAHFERILADMEIMLARKGEDLARLKLDREAAEAKFKQRNIFLRIFHKLTGSTPSFSFEDPFSFTGFTQEQKNLYMMMTVLGASLYKLLKVKVLDDQGLITTESENAITDSNKILVGV